MSTQACNAEIPGAVTVDVPAAIPPQQTLLDLLRHGRHEEALSRALHPEEVNQLDNGSTPLLIATTRGWEDVVIALVKNGANVNVASELGETPLMRAIKCGKISAETIRLILQFGGGETINLAAGENAFFSKWTALHFACDMDLNPNPVVIALLVSYGANIKATAGNGKTPVDMCSGREECMKALTKPMDVLKSHNFTLREPSEEPMTIGSESTADGPRRSSLINFGLHLFSKKGLEKKGSMVAN